MTLTLPRSILDNRLQKHDKVGAETTCWGRLFRTLTILFVKYNLVASIEQLCLKSLQRLLLVLSTICQTANNCGITITMQ